MFGADLFLHPSVERKTGFVCPISSGQLSIGNFLWPGGNLSIDNWRPPMCYAYPFFRNIDILFLDQIDLLYHQQNSPDPGTMLIY